MGRVRGLLGMQNKRGCGPLFEDMAGWGKESKVQSFRWRRTRDHAA